MPIKISELPAAGPITGSELIPIVQDGETKQASANSLSNGISASGALGAVQLSDGSGGLSSYANFVWDTVNNRLGVGTSTPSYPVHSRKSDAATSASVCIEQAGTGAATLQFTRLGASFYIGISGTTFGLGTGISGNSPYLSFNPNFSGSINTTPNVAGDSASLSIYPAAAQNTVLNLLGRPSFSGKYLNILDSSYNRIFTVEPDGSLHHGLQQRSFSRKIKKDFSAITSWTTITTLTFNTTTNVYTGITVNAKVGGHTDTIGTGVLHAMWGATIENAAPVLFDSGKSADIGAKPPQFRLLLSGSSILCQVQSNNGINTITGTCELELFIPRDTSNLVQWTIT